LLHQGEELLIHRGPVPPGADGIALNYPEALASLTLGDQIFFADGSIRASVVQITTEGVLVKVLQGGNLSTRKGVNLPVKRIESLGPDRQGPR
jgi:pyruvate kinase